MTVEFCLLGDAEVRVGAQRLDIGHARRRCVLVALVVDVNHAISPEQLVDRVWSDRPPRRARNSLAGYVSRLRTLLGQVDGVVISRGPAGYMLTADAMSVDLHRFRHLAAQARASTDPAQAAALFDRALAEWSGEPFMFLDTPWLNEVRSAVRAEKFAVELDRNDVALRAGRHADLLIELTATQAAHPLDERLAGQLMLAQYRSGRQGDALDTYRRTRLQLVNELGVEPGVALRDVHQQILSGHVATEATPRDAVRGHDAMTPAPAAFDRPHSGLLRRATSFIGHEAELAQTVEALRAGPLVTLTGVGGVGKTRLAWEVARRDQQRFADGVWICELGPLGNGDPVGHPVAAALRLRQQQGMGIEESVIEYLRSRTALLVLDNCEHVLEAAAGLAQRIVQHCPDMSVLATSRQPLGVEGEQILVVQPLPVQDATRLFADRARTTQPNFSLDQQPVGAVAEICRRVDCLPLGVELAAARMRVMSASDVVRRLDRLGFLRGAMRGAHPRQQSLTAAIDWSYRLLTEAEQTLFARLSVFAGSFDLDAAQGVCGVEGVDEDDTLELLAGLVDKSMVVVRNVTDRTRYAVLETLRAYGRERLQEQGIEKELAIGHAQYFTALAERAGAGVHTAEERDWVERVLPDYDNLRTAFERAMTDGDIDLCMRLVTSVAELLGLRVGHDVARWADRLVAVADRDHPLFAAVVGTAARGAWNGGDPARARALVERAAGRVPGRGAGRISYPADVAADMSLFGAADDALAHWSGEAERARREDDPIRLVQSVSALAVSQGLLGNPQAALPAAEEAVGVADVTANPTARSMAYFSLGYLLKKSEPARALVLFDEAARLAQEVRNFWWFGIALMEGAATRAIHGDSSAAARKLIEVLDHWERVGDWVEQWVALRYITRFLARVGEADAAVFLHYAIVNAGKPPPLRPSQLDLLVDRLGADHFAAYRNSAPSGPGAVARARSTLQGYAEEPAPEFDPPGACHKQVRDQCIQ